MHLSDANEADGNPITKPSQVSSHRKKAPRFDYRIMVYVIMAALGAGGLITNASKIMDVIWLLNTANAEAITLPRLPATLRNSGTEPIALRVQGNCLLWPPEPHRWDYEGAYQFKHTDLTDIDSDRISIPAGDEREFLIELIRAAPIHQTKTSLKRFLTTGEWHIQFILETDQYGRSLNNSDRIPFTVEAFSAGFTLEVFRKPYPRASLD